MAKKNITIGFPEEKLNVLLYFLNREQQNLEPLLEEQLDRLYNRTVPKQDVYKRQTLRIYTRQVSPAEERKIISNAANKNRMRQGSTENLQDTITAGNNLQDVADIVSQMHRNKEPLLHLSLIHI